MAAAREHPDLDSTQECNLSRLGTRYDLCQRDSICDASPGLRKHCQDFWRLGESFNRRPLAKGSAHNLGNPILGSGLGHPEKKRPGE